MNITQEAIALTQLPQTNYYSQCYNFAENWIKSNLRFTSEDLIEAYKLSQNPLPKEPRVWGAVISNLRKLNSIKAVGTTKYKNPNGHQKPCYIWESNSPDLKIELAEINFSYKKDLYELLQRVELGGISAESAMLLIDDMIEIQVLKSQLKQK